MKQAIIILTLLTSFSALAKSEKSENLSKILCASDNASTMSAIYKLNGKLSKFEFATNSFENVYSENHQAAVVQYFYSKQIISASSPVTFQENGEQKVCVTLTLKRKR